MPELPEVEAARRAVEENCLGKKIKRAIIANDSKVIEGVSSSEFESAVVGKTIVAAHRKGKNLWLQLDSPPFPTFQFGMAGAIYIKGVAVTKYTRSAVKDNDEWPSKYSKFFVELDDGLELSFTVIWLVQPISVPQISELGPDALFEPMPVDEFTESLGKKKIAIKALLLDQSFISGIGNWIADEVLYQARIHPLQASSSLSKENCAALHKCIKETSAYVPELQKLSGASASKAAAGKPGKQASKRKGGKTKDTDEDEGAADEPTSEEEETAKITKSRKGGNPKGHGKKPPVKRKTKESDDDDDNDDGGKGDASSEEDDEDPEEKAGKVKTRTSNRQVKKSDHTASSQNGKKSKRAK